PRRGDGVARPMNGRGPGEAPAAKAALGFVAGIWLGSWSVRGTAEAAALAALCAILLALRAARGRGAGLSAAALVLLWASLGFLEGRIRIARPARAARETFAALAAGRDRADRVEGVLTDFWTGAPPRVHGRLRAERIEVNGAGSPRPPHVVPHAPRDAPGRSRRPCDRS